jgi:hypothetical protein
MRILFNIILVVSASIYISGIQNTLCKTDLIKRIELSDSNYLSNCDLLIGSWQLVSIGKIEENQKKNSLNNLQIKSFLADGEYVFLTKWDTTIGKWYVNDVCDSLAIYENVINPIKIEFHLRFYFENELLILEQIGRHGFIKFIYKKI